MSKAVAAIDPTVQFLSEQLAILGRFGDAMPFLLLRPITDGKIAIHAQDPRGFVLLKGTSTKSLGIPHMARLDNLGYLKSILDLVQKNATRGKTVPLEFESALAADKTNTAITYIRFRAGPSTTYSFRASDPFQNKTPTSKAKITEWPVEVHMNTASIEHFEDAARTHLAGALKADDQNFFYLSVSDGEINVRFESRAGKIKHQIGETKGPNLTETPYDIGTFRSVLSTMGPDGGILKIAQSAISMDTETASGLYTFVLTKKISR